MSVAYNPRTVAAPAAPAENMLFREEVKPAMREMLSFSIRKDASADEILKTLHGACEAYKQGATVIQQLKLVIGKTLAVVRDRKLFGAHRTFEAFIKAEIVDRYSIGRSTAWEAIKVASAFPEVNSVEYQQIGATKLIAAARVAAKLKPEQRPMLDALLHEPKPLDEFTSALNELIAGPVQAKSVAQLVFRVAPELAREWREWCALPHVIEAAGGGEPTTDAFFTLAFRAAQDALAPKRGPVRAARRGNAA